MSSLRGVNKQGKGVLVDEITRRLRMIVFDFDGVFTDNRVIVLENGKEGVFCSRADGFGLDAMRRMGLELLVLSKEKNPVVSARCRKLNIRCIQGCDDKLEALTHEAEKRDIPMSDIAYMGNDINDLECLGTVGLPVCVADAHPDVLDAVLYTTRTNGGYGAVREFCEYVAKVKSSKNLRKPGRKRR